MAVDLQKLLTVLTGGFDPITRGPVGKRAAAEAQLRYLPALHALGLLGQQQRQQYRTDVRGIKRSGSAAATGIGSIRTNLLQQLSDTPAPTSEAAAHLGLTRDAVAGDLARMQAQQTAGITAGVSQARGKYQSDLADVVRQMFQTADQGRLYNVGQYEALAADQRKAKQASRQWQAEQNRAYRTAGFDPKTGQPTDVFKQLHPGPQPDVNQYGYTDAEWRAMPLEQRIRIKRRFESGGGKPKAAPGTAGAATQSDYKQYQKAFSQAKRLVSITLGANPDASDHELAVDVLRDGVIVGRDARGNPIFKTLDNEAAVWAALQTMRHGGITSRTAGLLHQQGLSVKRLGYKPWRPKKQRRPSGSGVGGAIGGGV